MRRLLSVSIPDGLAEETDALAEETDALAEETDALALALGKTKSEVVRDALRRYVQTERFTALQGYGRERAEALGIGPDDTEALIDEVRARRS